MCSNWQLYGRVPVLQLANLEYLIFNAACGAARNEKEMIAFRFLAGIGGSALGTVITHPFLAVR